MRVYVHRQGQNDACYEAPSNSEYRHTLILNLLKTEWTQNVPLHSRTASLLVLSSRNQRSLALLGRANLLYIPLVQCALLKGISQHRSSSAIGISLCFSLTFGPIKTISLNLVLPPPSHHPQSAPFAPLPLASPLVT